MLSRKYSVSAMVFIALLLVINQWQITSLSHMLNMEIPTEEQVDLSSAGQTAKSDSSVTRDIRAVTEKILAKGIPPVYGAELKISFDQAAASIPILAKYEQDTRVDKLTGNKLKRYIKIGQSTSCEFCCGAKTMVFSNGSKACGCAHSAAMRGVVAYLLDNYGDQMTDEQILAEANKWKTVYFPGPTVNKYLSQAGQSGGSTGLQQQVGGC